MAHQVLLLLHNMPQHPHWALACHGTAFICSQGSRDLLLLSSGRHISTGIADQLIPGLMVPQQQPALPCSSQVQSQDLRIQVAEACMLQRHLLCSAAVFPQQLGQPHRALPGSYMISTALLQWQWCSLVPSCPEGTRCQGPASAHAASPEQRTASQGSPCWCLWLCCQTTALFAWLWGCPSAPAPWQWHPLPWRPAPCCTRWAACLCCMGCGAC